MNIEGIGAVLIVAGCGSCGFYAAAAGNREVKILKGILRAVSFMESELRYNLKPLPVLCAETAGISKGSIREIFENLSKELESQLLPDAASCMASAIEKSHDIPGRARQLLHQMGQTLGRFDLTGQLNELEQLFASCEKELNICTQGQENRLKGYRTLGLCTGAALAILLL